MKPLAKRWGNCLLGFPVFLNENRYAWSWRGSIRKAFSLRDAKSFASPPQPARTMALWNGDNAYRTLDLFLLRGVQTKLRYFASILKLAVARRIVTCTCQCVRLLIAPTILPLSTVLHPVTSWQGMQVCLRSKISGHLRERSVVSLITPKVLKEARRCELVLRDSFPFRWSTSEVQAKWPVSAHTHRHSCWTDSKSFENPQLVWTGMWNLQRRSNGERTDRQSPN